jgi:hypothetical protein
VKDIFDGGCPIGDHAAPRKNWRKNCCKKLVRCVFWVDLPVFQSFKLFFYDIYCDDHRRPTADRWTQAMMFVTRPF